MKFATVYECEAIWWVNLLIFTGVELRMTTSTRLKTCLYSFTSPGGPMYPTRAVRHAAWDALDFLFPVSAFFLPFAISLMDW